MQRPAPHFLEGDVTSSIIGCMYEVHRELGFGFREPVYAAALERLLVAKGHRVAREVRVMVYFRGEPLRPQVLDMIVDDKVVVEIKSTERLAPTAAAQLLAYLAATKLEVGLVLHFGREARAHRAIFENRLKKFQ